MVFISRKIVVVLFVGILACVFGIVFLFCFPLIFQYLLKQQISLVNGTIGYKVWQDIPLPIYQRLYFFNISNADAFVHRRAKPSLQEIGPYTFISKWVKKDIVWHSNGTVSFKEVRVYEFLRNESVGSEGDQVVTLNGPLLMAIGFLKKYPLSVRLAASFLLGAAGERLIVKKSIRQLAFDGYRDIIILLSPLIKQDIPFKSGMFSWLYAKNDTDDGLYTVFTGETGLEHLNIIDRWNGNKLLKFWGGKSCNMINGSNGEIGPSNVDGQKTYKFFQSIFCRTLTLSHLEKVEHLGIRAERFVATKSTFANGTDNSDNVCFETEMKLPSGAQDISICQYGAPVVISFPHFYLADTSYLQKVDGLHPNASKHSFHIDVESNTGFSVDAAVRFQINIYLERVLGFAQLRNVPKVVFPIFWIEIDFSLTEDIANLFKRHITVPKMAVNIFIWCCIAFGGLTTIGALVVTYWIFFRNRKIFTTEVVAAQ